MLRKENYELPERPLVLPEFLLSSLTLDGDSGNAARIIDQLNFVRSRLSDFTVKHTESAHYSAVVRHDGRRPGGTQSGSHSQIPEGRKNEVQEHGRGDNMLP